MGRRKEAKAALRHATGDSLGYKKRTHIKRYFETP